jgi:hypothetical protein
MIKNLKNQVKQILRMYPETRNSDIALTIKLWQVFYGIGEAVNVKNLYDLPREDNVKRIRAKFCEQGFSWAYPTELKIALGRQIKEEEWKRALGYIPQQQNLLSQIYN